MAQYGGEQQYRREEGYQGEQQYRREEGHQGEGYNHVNPLHSTNTGHETGGYGVGGVGTNIGKEGGQGYEEGKHGGILHRTGSGSSSSSESDGEGGRRKKKGVMEKIKEKLPGGDHGSEEHKASATGTVEGGGYGYEGAEGHEKKGIMDKIKEKLPGGHDHQ